MKKMFIAGLFCLFLIGSVFGVMLYNNAQHYVRDRVSGKNLDISEFADELGIIDSLIYNDMVKKSYNTFSGEIGYGIGEEGNEIFVLNNPKFEGRILFDDNSKVVYELTDIEVEGTNVGEYGITDAWATGNFTYEATLKIKRSLPVEASFSFFEDEEDSEYNEQEIVLKGEDLFFLLENEEGVNTFHHQRKCVAGCE